MRESTREFAREFSLLPGTLAATHTLAPTGASMTADINEPRKLGLTAAGDKDRGGAAVQLEETP